ncbi:helix-turn-helix domain-containing protein [Paracoccaceae bacterium Fryx2]|nr:helix-turn-helix domain-containing protein [Paracoccaceae bacterium Fryx2]
MSVQAITWAFQASVADPIKKFILVTLGNYADEYGVCWPSQSTLIAACACSERKLRESLKSLEAEGWIKRIQRRRKNGSRRSDAVLLVGFSERKIPLSADEHPILALLDVVPDDTPSTITRHVVPGLNRHVVPGLNRHVVPDPPARGAPLEPSLEPSITTTGARGTREPWLDRCLEAVNSHAVDAAALASNHELLAIWKREGYDLDADVIPLLVARTEVPRPMDQRITSWTYFRDALRSAKTKRLRQAETARIAENGKTAPAAVPPDPEAALRQLADWINSGQPVPSSAVSNVKRDALIGLKLVTRERLRELGVY